jgi:cytoskeletal protein RodZ
MQTIGEKLLEAREKKGVSLRDASETTKIRADFLAHFENDEYDFDLPEIYKRGFIRNYARFLKLDTESILADYTAQRLNTASRSRREGAANDLFGEIDLQPQKSVDRKATAKVAAAKPVIENDLPTRPVPVGKIDDIANDDDINESGMSFEDKMRYLKIGTVVAGVLVAILIIVWLVSMISGGKATVDSTQDQAETPRRSSELPTTTPRTSATETFVLHATGNVYAIVDEPHSGVEHFRGRMTAGQSRQMQITAPVRIRLTAGENIEFEFRDERIRPSRDGTSIINLP